MTPEEKKKVQSDIYKAFGPSMSKPIKNWTEIRSRQPCCICGPTAIKRLMVVVGRSGEEIFYCIHHANKYLGRKEWIARYRKKPPELVIKNIRHNMIQLKRRISLVENLVENLILNLDK